MTANSSDTNPPPAEAETQRVVDYLKGLQTSLCEELSAMDGKVFEADEWLRPQGGGGTTCLLEGGDLFERAGVGVSHVFGNELPPSASLQRPELAGRGFEAMGLSLVFHPRNPFVPTTHANIRFFIAASPDSDPVWWFGGGFDLTPYYGFEEDCQHWHRTARDAVEPFGSGLYRSFKKACDDYFFIKHRQEARGIGGLFFDDFDDGGFEHSFGLMQSVGNHFIKAYKPIVEKRRDIEYGEQQREFQHYRRGRYVEFNLVQDRGTLFGLQSGGRTESILMSMPPAVQWRYNWEPEAGTAEELLYTEFLPAREWI